MAFTVGTNTYITETEFTDYATERDITIIGTPDVLRAKAMDYIELLAFKGEKTDSEQALQFPRNGDTEVPENIKTAQIVTMLLIDSGVSFSGASSPSVKQEKILNVIEVEYSDSGSLSTYPQLAALLAPYLVSSGSTINLVRA